MNWLLKLLRLTVWRSRKDNGIRVLWRIAD